MGKVFERHARVYCQGCGRALSSTSSREIRLCQSCQNDSKMFKALKERARV